jgi:hypothetical protein
MARTQIRTGDIGDGSVNRDDLDITTAGKAVIRKIIQGTGVTIGSTGADSGTGDVTINIGQAVGSGNSPTFAGLTLTTTLAVSNASGRLDVTTGSYGVYLTASEDSATSNYGHLTFVGSSFNFLTGALKIGGTTVIDASRNLSNIGTISSGAITATVNGIVFTGTGALAGGINAYLTNTQARATDNRSQWFLRLTNNTNPDYVLRHRQVSSTDNDSRFEIIVPAGTAGLYLDRNSRLYVGGSTLWMNNTSSALIYLSNSANTPYLSYGTVANSFTLSDTSRHWMTIDTTAVTISFSSGAPITCAAITTSGNIKTVQNLAGYASIGAVNTNTAQSTGFYFAEVNNGTTPAYLIRYGSTHATLPEQLAIINGSTVGHIRLQSSKTTGTAFEFYANGGTRATIDAAGNGVFNGTLNVASGFVTTDLQPSTDGGLNLGTQSKKWSNFYMSGAQVMVKRSDTGSSPTSNTEVHWFIYDSGGSGYYVVFKWNDGGTVRYKYMRLDGTSTTWTHATTLPV